MTLVDLPMPIVPISFFVHSDDVCDAAIFTHNWQDRARALDATIGMLDDDEYWCLALTSALESLGEHVIRDLSAAMFYLTSTHREWRVAAKEFLTQVDPRSVVSWVNAHAGYDGLARRWRAPVIH